MKKNIGIIGNGFVGESQAFAFSPTNPILIYDVDPLRSNAKLEDVHNCDIIFVCVPTPMFKDGSQDLTYIMDVFKNAKGKGIYVIKSLSYLEQQIKLNKLTLKLMLFFHLNF